MSSRSEPANPLLCVKGLSKCYVQGALWRNRTLLTAVDNVDLEIMTGRTLALVGASGSGKSTLARCVAGLERPDGGQILIDGEELTNRSSGDFDSVKHKPRTQPFSHKLVQMIFQDAATSMNPRFTARQVLEEPLLIMGFNAMLRSDAARKAANEVGLSADWLDRSAMDFSGGQRQRLAIARALALWPKLLVLDEALTGLDLSTQAQIVNLLLELQAAHSLTYLLISHDLSLVARMADTIAVMSRGCIVERGSGPEIMAAAKHEETLRLLASARAAQSNLSRIMGEPV